MKAMRLVRSGWRPALALVNLALVNPVAGQSPTRTPLPGVKTLRDLPYVENGN